MKSIRSYQREIAKLYGILQCVEWVQPSYNGSPSCSFCGSQQHFDHAAGCDLAEVLQRRGLRADISHCVEAQS